jgi:transcriptional regulator with XRE-family HTH domain
MSLISKKFADELAEKGARVAYLAAQTRTKIVAQIRAIRKRRGWSQAEFAKLLGKPASNVSQRLENRDYSGFTVNTLLEVAAAFDVGLSIEFVPYEDFIRRTDDLSDDALDVSAFDPNDLQSLRNDDVMLSYDPVFYSIPLTQDRILGGSSSLNGMSQRGDFDHWAERGNRRWSYDDIMPYFKRGERRLGVGDDRADPSFFVPGPGFWWGTPGRYSGLGIPQNQEVRQLKREIASLRANVHNLQIRNGQLEEGNTALQATLRGLVSNVQTHNRIGRLENDPFGEFQTGIKRRSQELVGHPI